MGLAIRCRLARLSASEIRWAVGVIGYHLTSQGLFSKNAQRPFVFSAMICKMSIRPLSVHSTRVIVVILSHRKCRSNMTDMSLAKYKTRFTQSQLWLQSVRSDETVPGFLSQNPVAREKSWVSTLRETQRIYPSDASTCPFKMKQFLKRSDGLAGTVVNFVTTRT